MKPFIIAGLALSLAGCQTVKDAINPPLPGPTVPIDQRIAKISEELAKQCALLQTGIVLAQTFSKSDELKRTLVVAEAARKEFCAAPPTDVNSAIATVAAMAIAVNLTLREQNTAAVTQ